MGCEGSEIEYKDIMPAELQALRKKIATYTSGKMGQTATALPEGFPLSAQVNPLQTNAANIMNMLMGGGVMGNTGYNTSPGGYGGGAAGGGIVPRGYAQVANQERRNYNQGTVPYPPYYPGELPPSAYGGGVGQEEIPREGRYRLPRER